MVAFKVGSNPGCLLKHDRQSKLVLLVAPGRASIAAASPAQACLLGGHVRVGLEDNLYLNGN
jgi:hypothetical protein